MSTLPVLNDLPRAITSIGALGTAAFGLVDAGKVVGVGNFRINDIGFPRIRRTVSCLTPGAPNNALSQRNILATLKANWYNGTDLRSQKAIAKSLIKLNLNPGNAAALAAETNVDPGVLTTVAANIAAGTPLNAAQSDVYARFDLIVTALLDETYQLADNFYRNWTRALAGIVAIALALAGDYMLEGAPLHILRPVLVGLLATPLAPIAKDLSSALATAVNALQATKK